MSIFNFNHIDKNLTKEEIQEIKELYKYYHSRYWCYQKAYKYFEKLKLAINMSCTGLIVVGAVAGGLTANPGSISDAGLAFKTFSETKDYKRKIETSKFAYTTHQKVLLDLRTALRGGSFNKNDFLKELNIPDDTITDFFPLVTKFEKQYGKQFLSTPTTNSN